MFVGKQKIIEWYKFNDRPRWRIKKTANSEPIIESQGDNPDINEGLQQLEQAFTWLSPGQYFMETWKGNDKKNWNKVTIVINEGSSDSKQPANITGIYGENDVQALVLKGIEDYKKEVEHQQLKDEVEQLRAEQNSFSNRLLQKLEPYVPMLGAIINNAMGGDNSQIAGTKKKVMNKQNNNTMDDNVNLEEIQQRAGKAFAEWHKQDNEAIILLEKISQLVTKDPNTYEMAKNLLMKM